MAAPVEQVYTAFSDPARRDQWLTHADLGIRKANPHKSLRMSWGDGASEVRVDFNARGPEKTQVVVQHRKLASPAEAEEMKAYWEAQLASLKALLEE